MKNVYDIRYEKNLSFIFSAQCRGNNYDISPIGHEHVAIMLYLYYEDTLSEYFKYFDNIPEDIHVYIISSRESVLNIVRKYSEKNQKRNFSFLLKENRGRDISALLVVGAEIVKKYLYVCFIHDKKEHPPATKEETELWIENLWGNLIGSNTYVESVLKVFAENPMLGILSPPDPIGDHFCTWYGLGWHDSYQITKKIAEKLQLKADMDINKPPITIGTALWFRTEALKKLFEAGWDYEDFDDGKLKDSNYLSYGIERIFAYVAQDAGFDTGEVMTAEYAEKQNSYLHYAIGRIFIEMIPFFPLPMVAAVDEYKRNLPRLIEFVERNRKIYLYGAGVRGRFCLALLRHAGVKVEGFIVSSQPDMEMVEVLPVIMLQNIDFLSDSDIGVVITVVKEEERVRIVEKLRERKFSNYLELWK